MFGSSVNGRKGETMKSGKYWIEYLDCCYRVEVCADGRVIDRSIFEGMELPKAWIADAKFEWIGEYIHHRWVSDGRPFDYCSVCGVIKTKDNEVRECSGNSGIDLRG